MPQEKFVGVVNYHTGLLAFVEPLLTDHFGFHRWMLHEECNRVFNQIEDNLSKEEQERLQQYKLPVGGYDICSFIIDGNYNLEIYMGDLESDKFIELLSNYGLAEHISMKFTLIMLFSIYIKNKDIGIEGINLLENTLTEQEVTYSNHVRPEMLQLYNFINDWKKQPTGEPVILACGSKKMKLNNYNSWIFTAIDDYLHKYLGVDSVEDAKEELELNYSSKSGNKMHNEAQNIFLGGIDALLTDLLKEDGFSNAKCHFIRDILVYVGLFPDVLYVDDEIKNIRAKLKYLRKIGYKANWTKMLYATSPNNKPEDNCYKLW